MTSTERAALRLALGVLRRFLHLSPRTRPAAAAENDLYSAAYVLALDEDPPTGAGDMPTVVALGNALMAADTPENAIPPRILRARLALLLRAVLRAEAGEIGHATPSERGWVATTYPADRWLGYVSRSIRWREEFAGASWHTSSNRNEDRYERVRLAVPLWSQAPGRKT